MSLLRTTALASSAARVLVGTAMVAKPREIGESWIGETGRFESVSVLTRAVGARDAALGGFAVAALTSDRDDLARTALLGAVVCDLTDLLAMVAVRKKIPDRSFAMIAPLAGTFAAVGIAAAAEL